LEAICYLTQRNYNERLTVALFSRLDSPSGSRHGWGSATTFIHTTVGRTPVDEWSARRRDFHLTTHNTLNRETSMAQAGL